MPDEGKGKIKVAKSKDDLTRTYTWTGGRFSSRPDMSDVRNVQGATVTVEADRVTIAVTHARVWGVVNRKAGQAIARAVGGADVESV
jgi:hypothetical protein